MTTHATGTSNMDTKADSYKPGARWYAACQLFLATGDDKYVLSAVLAESPVFGCWICFGYL